MSRDFAFIVDRSVKAGDIVRTAQAADKKLITNVTVFDVYEGKGIDEAKKSIAIAVTLQPREKTLTDQEIDAVASRSSRMSPRRPAACCAADRSSARPVQAALAGGGRLRRRARLRALRLLAGFLGPRRIFKRADLAQGCLRGALAGFPGAADGAPLGFVRGFTCEKQAAQWLHQNLARRLAAGEAADIAP